jgi:hypothetical protein
MKPHTESCTIFGLPCEVEFDYSPEERQTLEYPGCDESYEITAVYVTTGRSVEPTGTLKPPSEFPPCRLTTTDILDYLTESQFDDLIEQLKDKRCDND